MAKASPKGSIIYKIIIVLLAAALIATILYPKSLWKKETQNTKACHERMEHILSAELQYMMHFNTYNDTLSRVVNFIKEDTTGARLLSYLKYDSVLTLQVINALRLDDSLNTVIDSMRAYCAYTAIDTVEEFIVDSLRFFPHLGSFIDSMAMASLDSLFVCPTTRDSYKITVIDTSVIKVLQIACPIDSLDSLKVANDFKLSKLGALKISNHGNIDGGTKHWD
jgi:hypothetical protein